MILGIYDTMCDWIRISEQSGAKQDGSGLILNQPAITLRGISGDLAISSYRRGARR